ncbi:lipoyltransferase [Novosphingobium sp. 9]|uniref:lipoyltransferase n=1 Tax=Novosphingobium sp. 9 TaxID=2025349 RepID=UPI0021B6D85F|nr:lipoyltransferase [Novosphingobium sp. 9]
MKFDSNRAWQDSVAAVRANREVLFAVAGVFFLLPSLLAGVLLTGLETQIYTNFENKTLVNQLVMDNIGTLFGVGLGSVVMQLIGYFALARLLADRARPTVGTVIASAIRALPTLIATMVIALAATMAVLVLPAALFAPLGGAGAALGAVVSLFGIALLIHAAVRVSLLVPVVVNDGLLNPVHALRRSWQLTRRHALRLFGFFCLLMLAYLIIGMVVNMALITPVLLLAGEGNLPTLWAALVSGLFNAVASVVTVAVLVAIHRQLSSDSAAPGRPFE